MVLFNLISSKFSIAKFEAEQQDISLANTLDTLKETGASAGGATALAQAALQGKKGISANIEQQEAQNEKLRAQGEQEMERIKMSEAQRIQNVKMSEGARVQGARAQGAAFVFGAKEDREQQQIDRTAAQLGGAAAAEGQARADQTSAITGMIGGLASIAGSAARSGSNGGSSTNSGSGSYTASGSGMDTTNPAFQSPVSAQFDSNYTNAATPTIGSNWGMGSSWPG